MGTNKTGFPDKMGLAHTLSAPALCILILVPQSQGPYPHKEPTSSIMAAEVLPRPANLLLRVAFFFSKRPSMTRSEFDTYWRDTHGALCVASRAFRASNCHEYTQIHNDHTLNKEAAKMGLPMLEFEWDASSEMYFQSWEDYQRFANSDEMRDVLGPDGLHIMDTSKGVKVVISRVDPVFKNNVP